MSRNKFSPRDLKSIEMYSIPIREEGICIQSTICWPLNTDILYIKSEFELYESVFIVCGENELWTELPPVLFLVLFLFFEFDRCIHRMITEKENTNMEPRCLEL